MSITVLPPAAGDFEFAAQVADFFTQPLGQPSPSLDSPARQFRPTKAAERRHGREVIDRELGIVRHRSREREA